MTIEDRLARDAAQTRLADPPAPSLDLLLDRALATAPRRRPQLWLAVAAVVLVVAGVAAFVTVRLTHDTTAPAAGVAYPKPHTITRNGTTFTVGETSPIGITRDAAAPDVVDVYVFDRYVAGQPQCSRFSPSVRVLRQTATAVRLVTFDYSTTPIDQQVGCAYSGVGSQAAGTLFRVHLDAPLASRRIVDVRTGRPLALIVKAAAPTPGFVPAGYRQADAQGFDPPQSFAAERSYRKGSAMLFLQFTEAADSAPLGSVTGHRTVHGRPATVSAEGPIRCLAWSEPTGLGSQVCSQANGGPLPVTVLLRVADSLPH